MTAHRIRPFALALARLLPSALAASCSSDTVDKAKDTAESAADDVDNSVDSGTARAQAEAMRAALKANDTADADGLRSVEALQQTADDLPGDPEVTGITDADGDGLDDDGKVQVTVDDQSACLTIPETGDDTEVSGGAC